MTFDIVEYTDEQLKEMTTIQMQLLRTAQKKKDELKHSLDRDIAQFRELLLAQGTANSTLFEDKRAALTAEYEYRVEILREQLLYSMELNEPYPDADRDQESVGYLVDYSLSYTERYHIVRDYYLAIEDPVERMSLYSNDEVAMRYLGSYYSTLYNVLHMYSQ